MDRLFCWRCVQRIARDPSGFAPPHTEHVPSTEPAKRTVTINAGKKENWLISSVLLKECLEALKSKVCETDYDLSSFGNGLALLGGW